MIVFSLAPMHSGHYDDLHLLFVDEEPIYTPNEQSMYMGRTSDRSLASWMIFIFVCFSVTDGIRTHSGRTSRG